MYVIPSCYYRWGDAVFGFILHNSNDNYSSFKQLIWLEMIVWDISHTVTVRDQSIMLIILPIMLCSGAQILCSILCSCKRFVVYLKSIAICSY